MPTRRVLLVDDEVTVLLTMKAVLEISGFNVDTAASAREGKSKIRQREYQMIITDMRMESDAAGREVIQAARNAPYHPAVALLTAYPVTDEDWQDGAPDKMLVKPMHTRQLLQQLESLFAKRHGSAEDDKVAAPATGKPAKKSAAAVKSSEESETPAKPKPAAKKTAAKKAVAKSAARKAPAKKAAK